MTYLVGGDHYNNRIPHKDLQIYCHRVYAKIPWGLPDSQLRHSLYYDVFKTTGANNDFYTRDDINLCNFLEDCKLYNIVPIVNNNATYLDPFIPIEEYARRSKIIDDLMFEAGFELGYQSLMNEPGKRYNTHDYISYVNAAKAKITHYEVIAGNDEYNMLDWNYLLDNGNFDILGVHPLSSLGYPPDWDILNDWATMATARGKPYMITEGGSWFKSYFSSEGWEVIKDTILKAKQLGYLATCIVLLDCNKGSYPKLGFRRFDKTYMGIESVSEYWDDFINLVNSEGKKYEQIPIEENDDMKLELLKIGSKGNQVKWLQEILEQEYGYENTGGYDGIFGTLTDTQVKEYQTDMGIDVDGVVGKATTFELIEKSGEHFSSDYWKTKLEIFMAYN